MRQKRFRHNIEIIQTSVRDRTEEIQTKFNFNTEKR
jgi:hypothetical protein